MPTPKDLAELQGAAQRKMKKNAFSKRAKGKYLGKERYKGLTKGTPKGKYKGKYIGPDRFKGDAEAYNRYKDEKAKKLKGKLKNGTTRADGDEGFFNIGKAKIKPSPRKTLVPVVKKPKPGATAPMTPPTGIHGGWTDANGVRHEGNEPGKVYAS